MFIRTRWNKFLEHIINNKLDFLIVFLLSLIILTWLQATPTFTNPEAFYHAQVVETMQPDLFLNSSTPIPGMFNLGNYSDNSQLYHFLLVPFARLLPTFIALKLASILFSSLLLLIFYWWLKKHQGKWPFVFILMLLGTQAFVASLSSVTVVSLALIVLLLGVEAVIHYRYWLVFLISILFIWLSQAFILLLLFIIIWLLVGLFYHKSKRDRFREKLNSLKQVIVSKLGINHGRKKNKWLVLLMGGLGSGLAIIINPQWPQNIIFYFKRFDLAMDSSQRVFNSVLSGLNILFVFMLLTIVVVLFSRRNLSKLSLVAGVFDLFLLAWVINTSGQVEYFVFWSALFISLVWRDLLGDTRWRAIWRQISRKKACQAATVVVILGLVLVAGKGLYLTRMGSLQGIRLTNLSEVAEWLKYHVPDNSLIINDNWQDWSSLVYYDDSNRYFIGLEPQFLFLEQPQTATDYFNLVSCKSKLNPKLVLRDRLSGDYLLINNKNIAFNKQIKDNIYFQLVYEDPEAWIYKIQ